MILLLIIVVNMETYTYGENFIQKGIIVPIKYGGAPIFSFRSFYFYAEAPGGVITAHMILQV